MISIYCNGPHLGSVFTERWIKSGVLPLFASSGEPQLYPATPVGQSVDVPHPPNRSRCPGISDEMDRPQLSG